MGWMGSKSWRHRIVGSLYLASRLIPLVDSSCPCKSCDYRTICAKMEFDSVPFGIPKYVEILVLSENQINSIKYYDFSQFKDIKELYLEKNLIGSLEDKVFNHQSKMQKLHLDGNRIRHIKKGTLSKLRRLSHLFLDSNLLEVIPEDIAFMPNLQQISLSTNRIKTIPWWSFFNLVNVKKLYFFDNPFDCNCDNEEVHSWLAKEGTKFGTFNLRTMSQICDSNTTDVSAANSLLRRNKAAGCTTPEIVDIGQERRFAVDDRWKNMYISGSDAYLYCTVAGSPRPLVTWYTPQSDAVNIFNPSLKYTVFPNNTLRITDMDENDSGKFLCSAHIVSSQASKHVTITVKKGDPPEVTGYTRNLKTTEGMQTTIACNITGDPFPQVQWKTPRGKLLVPSDFSRSGKFSNRTYAIGSELVIRNVISEDSGEWSCIVSNFLDTVEQPIGVSVEEKRHGSASSVVMISGLSIVGIVVAVVIGIGIYYLHSYTKRMANNAQREEARKQREDEQHGMRI